MVYLIEDIDAVKRYYPNIPDEMFMTLISLDPTYRNNNSLGKYGKWILNLYNKGNLSEDEFDEVTPLLNQFTTYRNRIQNKDLNAYKSLDALAEILASVVDDDSMLTDRQKLRFLKNVKAGRIQTGAENDYDTVYEDDEWIVCVPNTHEASMKLGKGTSWCTAHEDPEWYNTYTMEDDEEFSLYIMRNKDTGERFQYCDNPYRGYDYQFMDENDDDVDVDDFMKNANENFTMFLVDLNPDFFKSFEWVGPYSDLKADGDTIVGTANYIEPDVVIPDGIKYIGDEAFYQNEDIESVRIPSSVEQIDVRAFGYSSLRKIYFDGNGLEYIGTEAFAECLLDYVYLPDSVRVVSMQAFENSDIIKIYFGTDIECIGALAFANATLLEEVYLEDSAEPLIIQRLAFKNCTSLSELHLSDNVKEIYPDAFAGCSDFTIYSDSQYVKDHIATDLKQYNITLCGSDGELIYDPDSGFVEEDE